MKTKKLPCGLIRLILSNGTQSRFWSFVKISSENDCWDWTGSTSSGYGQFGLRLDGKTIIKKSHKIAWISSNKSDVPDGLLVLHSCIGNKLCCNPNHLRPGTKSENAIDMYRQCRHPIAIFDEEMIRKIRLASEDPSQTFCGLSRIFGGTPNNIRSIVLRKTWAHIHSQ